MVIDINNVSELPIEKLQEMIDNGKDIEKIRITSEVGHSVEYDIEEYKKLYGKLLELVEGIDDNWSKTKKFTIIYKRVSQNIVYDEIAIYSGKINILKRKYAKSESENCRSLKNGLLYGKCVCQGYAEILRNACAIKGVKAIEINGANHAWNQVQIDNEEWIEVDPTWGHSDMIEYIGTDKKKFWKDHPREATFTKLYEKEEQVSDFDIVRFINSEFGLSSKEYYKRELKQLIDLMEKRDVYKEDISSELEEIITKIEKRKNGSFILIPYGLISSKEEKTKEIQKGEGKSLEAMASDLHPYVITELKRLLSECMITFEEACTILKFKHGEEKTSEIKEIQKSVKEKSKTKEIKEFEKECGYSLVALQSLGFSEDEIEKMRYKYNTKNGKKLNRRKIVQRNVKKKRRAKMNKREKIADLFIQMKKRILGKDEPILLPENQDQKEKF